MEISTSSFRCLEAPAAARLQHDGRHQRPAETISSLTSSLPRPLDSAPGNVGNGGKFDFKAVPNMFFNINVPSHRRDLIGVLWNRSPAAAAGIRPSASWSGGIPQFSGRPSPVFVSFITGRFSTVYNLNGAKTVGEIARFNNSRGYTIDPGTGGTLTIDDTGDTLGVRSGYRACSSAITCDPVARGCWLPASFDQHPG